MLRSGEVAKRPGLHPLTVRRWVKEGKIAAVQIGREQELTEDLLAIITSFAGRLYGLRSRKKAALVECAKQVLAKQES